MAGRQHRAPTGSMALYRHGLPTSGTRVPRVREPSFTGPLRLVPVFRLNTMVRSSIATFRARRFAVRR